MEISQKELEQLKKAIRAESREKLIAWLAFSTIILVIVVGLITQ